MLYLDSFLKNDVCKHGIVSFQLAKDITTSNEIINSWNQTSQIACGISLGLDFLFLISYPLLISILIHSLNEKLWLKSSIYNFSVILIFSLGFAALFDAIENIGLIQLLLGDIKQIWSSIAYYFAIPKFVIIVFGIIYILFNFVYSLFQKNHNEIL
ncbi:hypothetical protein [Tenacibaculum sp. 190130A14a]